MFLRRSARKKDGKVHCYGSVVENRASADVQIVAARCLWARALRLNGLPGVVAPQRPPPGISCLRQNHPIPGLALQAAFCRLRGMRRVSVPFHLVHAGDVLDLNGQGRFVVVTAVAEDKSGYLVIDAVSADEEPGQWRYPRKASPAAFARVGQGCAPTPNGLCRFLVKQQG
jgi:hypothetical protein